MPPLNSSDATFPQPPLQFYLDTIANQPWSEVSVLTFAETEELVNPTYSRLQEMKTEGLLGENVNFFMVSTYHKRHIFEQINVVFERKQVLIKLGW